MATPITMHRKKRWQATGIPDLDEGIRTVGKPDAADAAVLFWQKKQGLRAFNPSRQFDPGEGQFPSF